MKYNVTVSISIKWADAMDWCMNTYGEKSFLRTWRMEPSGTDVIFLFEKEEDMMLFKLKWL